MSAESFTEALVDLVEQGIKDATTTRYLSAVGLVLLLYDHILTLGDEVTYIWRAVPSFSKYCFLLNRYVVAANLITVAYIMNTFSNDPFPDITCRIILAVTSLVGVTSISIGNLLVLQRVVMLWDYDRNVKRFMTVGFIISFAATMGCMIGAVITLIPGVKYEPIVDFCITTKTSRLLGAVWASPMAFELLVLISVCWNAFARPRQSHTKLITVLYRDGITFFVALTAFRILNLVVAAVSPPTKVMETVFLVWALTTLILNRSLLNIQRLSLVRIRKEVHEGYPLSRTQSASGRASPFGMRLSTYSGDAFDEPEFEDERTMWDTDADWRKSQTETSPGSPMVMKLKPLRLSKTFERERNPTANWWESAWFNTK